MRRLVLAATQFFGRISVASRRAIAAWAEDYRAAFSAGDDRAAFRAYQRGDYATALRKWKPLAEQGHAGARYNLGIMYYFGDRRSFDPDAIPLDDAEAAKWFRLAAEQGQADAQAYIGRMYANAEGVPQDDVQAYKWFTLAADTSDSKEFGEGVQAVLQYRNELEAKMTPEQIVEAQKLAREWLEKNGQ